MVGEESLNETGALIAPGGARGYKMVKISMNFEGSMY